MHYLKIYDVVLGVCVNLWDFYLLLNLSLAKSLLDEDISKPYDQ